MVRNNVYRGHALRIAFGITILKFLLMVGIASVLLVSVVEAAEPVLTDNFDDNIINSSLWTGFARGYGPTYAETNQSLEVNIPSNSSNDPFWGGFGAGYKSIYSLRGDFDVQVDYNALIWPSTNGVRIGLGAYMTDPWVFFPDTFGNVERASFGPVDRDFIGYPREVYITAFSDYWNGNFYRETSDQSGTLRLVRSGSTLTGYYYSSNGWVEIHSAPVNTSDANLFIDTWSGDYYYFTNQEVKMAFDNFTINQGQLVYPEANPVLVDNFSDNAINTSIWAGLAHGYGPTYAETNQSLEINIPSNSAVDPSAEFFGAGYRSVCSLRGDFDIQTDYKLLTWPYANGVRVILGAVMLADPPWTPNPYTFGDAQRTSFGPTDYDFIGYPREVYIAYSSDAWTGNFYAPTSDQSGKLRLVRSGSTLTSYYYNQNNWVVIHSAPVNTSDANFTINAMSNNYFFTNQEVKVAFDNFTINQGQLICPKEDTIPPNTAINLSGILGNNNWYTSDVQVTLTAIDNDGGSGVNKTEHSFDNTSWSNYTTPFNISNEGTTTIYYRSTDNAGNVEVTKNQTIKIDKTPPVITGNAITSPNANDWYNNSVIVNFTASDMFSGLDTITPDITLSTEGANQSVTGIATDKAGNSASFTVSGINIDKTPPQIAINTPANVSYLILNQIILANWSANDSISGIASATGTTPSGAAINTASVGTKTFSVNAEDNAGNTNTKQITYYIHYKYSGILQPINAVGSSIFKLGSTVPVKFQLIDSNGNYVTDAVAKIYTAKISDGVTGTEIEANSTSNATTGNLFRYDSTSNQYIFNLATKTLSIGTWQIRIELDDGTSKYVTISLR